MEQSQTSANLTQWFLAGLAGDSRSYAQFLTLLTPVLRRIIARKIPASDVEDVLQEVLISIHKARHTYNGNRPLMPWVMAIVKFRMADALRKAYAGAERENVDIADVENMLADVTEPPHANESIEELLSGVADREQKILRLMHVEGYTAKETGERLGMKESAVKVAAHRAIKKIRKHSSDV